MSYQRNSLSDFAKDEVYFAKDEVPFSKWAVQPPWGVASISEGGNTKMGGWGAVTQKLAVEGQQFSSCSCCHEGRITGGIPGQFSFTNP